MKRYTLIDSKEKKFECDFKNCDKVFQRKDAMKSYKLIHSNERKFICDWNQCGLKFKYKLILSAHKKEVHFKVKSFKCSECHKRFNRKTALKQHLRIHSREKPFFRIQMSCNKKKIFEILFESSH